jgi:choline dehydrogenase-like flavoprotein
MTGTDGRAEAGEQVAVIGSGPAGAAAAWRLAQTGRRVVVIDVGREIEPELSGLARMPHPLDRAAFLERTSAARRRSLRGGGVLPPKLPFGSDFVYRGLPETALETAGDVHVETSLALGGLSNVWGANVSALAGRDMAGWPIGESDLAPYFPLLRDIVDVAGELDRVDRLYQAQVGGDPAYPLCAHARGVLDRLAQDGRGEALAAQGMHVGRAKIAVGPRYSVDGKGCVSCGLCMHGCPHGAVYNAADTIRRLEEEGAVTLLRHRLAIRFDCDETGVNLLCRRTGGAGQEAGQGGETETLRFSRVFIACGVMGSTALTARSMGWTDRVFTVRDSLKYYFPWVRLQAAANARNEAVNTLAQIFLQDVGVPGDPRTVHCQLYGVNDLFFESLRAKFGPVAGLAERLGTPLWNRMMIGMVYFHSDLSGVLRLTTHADPDRGLGRLEAGEGPDPAPIFAAFVKRLNAAAGALGGAPLAFLAERSPPGHSMHFGGSLPMRAKPGAGETDALGRPAGASRAHVVDTSVFPTIPGTPTTYAVMANAMRIVDAAFAG